MGSPCRPQSQWFSWLMMLKRPARRRTHVQFFYTLVICPLLFYLILPIALWQRSIAVVWAKEINTFTSKNEHSLSLAPKPTVTMLSLEPSSFQLSSVSSPPQSLAGGRAQCQHHKKLHQKITGKFMGLVVSKSWNPCFRGRSDQAWLWTAINKCGEKVLWNGETWFYTGREENQLEESSSAETVIAFRKVFRSLFKSLEAAIASRCLQVVSESILAMTCSF